MAFETNDRTCREAGPSESDAARDEAEIRYSLTALGEALVRERAGPRFRGFGPCVAASAVRA